MTGFLVGLLARGESRAAPLVTIAGVVAVVFSFVPQFWSYVQLTAYLDEQPAPLRSILLPNSVSWMALWLSSALLAIGLRLHVRLFAPHRLYPDLTQQVCMRA